MGDTDSAAPVVEEETTTPTKVEENLPAATPEAGNVTPEPAEAVAGNESISAAMEPPTPERSAKGETPAAGGGTVNEVVDEAVDEVVDEAPSNVESPSLARTEPNSSVTPGSSAKKEKKKEKKEKTANAPLNIAMADDEAYTGPDGNTIDPKEVTSLNPEPPVEISPRL